MQKQKHLITQKHKIKYLNYHEYILNLILKYNKNNLFDSFWLVLIWIYFYFNTFQIYNWINAELVYDVQQIHILFKTFILFCLWSFFINTFFIHIKHLIITNHHKKSMSYCYYQMYLNWMIYLKNAIKGSDHFSFDNS